MIAYLKGPITHKSPTLLVIEANGVGYAVHISLHTYALIEKMESVKLLTHLLIREDSHTLYGFFEEAERTLFLHLISVSGIGPTTAQIMLSAMQPDDVRAAIIGENEQAFSRVKGIGPKTAKRIIIDLKDKMLKEPLAESGTSFTAQDNTVREEALSALLALGFTRIQVQKALNQVLREQGSVPSVEQLIKLGLRQLSQ